MPEKEKREGVTRLQTLSVEKRKFIGQAIIDGLLSPDEVVPLPRYLQTGGNYDQRGAGDTNKQAEETIRRSRCRSSGNSPSGVSRI